MGLALVVLLLFACVPVQGGGPGYDGGPGYGGGPGTRPLTTPTPTTTTTSIARSLPSGRARRRGAPTARATTCGTSSGRANCVATATASTCASCATTASSMRGPRYDRSRRRSEFVEVAFVREADEGRNLQEARRACRDAAAAQGYDVREVQDADALGNRRYAVRLRIRTQGDRGVISCRYDANSGSAQIG